jgi:pyridoxal phosphate enzyme (YggS family)
MSFSIAENLNKIINAIPEDVSLVAVSKTKPIQDLKKAYEAGQRIFGENKVQELREKQPQLPNDIEWHMIGHMQTNKVKYIAPFVSLIHGVESFKLLKEINKQALKNERVIKILLQFHIATESTKFGLQLNEAKEILDSDEFKKLKNIEVSGVMGMASFVENESQVRLEFATLKSIFEELKSNYFSSTDSFKIVSMGMSGDYPIAIEEGSTMIRVGSSIFGTRN